MIGRVFFQRHVEKLPQRKAIATTPGNAPLRADTFKIADQQHPKISAWWNAWAAHRVVIMLLAKRLDEFVETSFGEQLIELAIENVTFGSRQSRRLDPHFLLTLLLAASQCHRITSCYTG